MMKKLVELHFLEVSGEFMKRKKRFLWNCSKKKQKKEWLIELWIATQ